VCCPSCRTSFSSAGPEDEEIPFVIPVEAPRGWNPAEPSAPRAPERKPRPGSSPAKKTSGTNGWAVALAAFVMVGGGLVVFGGILYFVATDGKGRPSPSKQSVRPFVDDRRQRQAVLDAFNAQVQVPEDEIFAEVRPAIEAVQRELRFGIGRDGVLDSFDVDRLFDELIEMDVCSEPMAGTRVGVVQGVRERLADVIQNQQLMLPWQELEIRNVKKVEGKNEASIVLRQRLVGPGHQKMRWWVSKRSGSWKVYDIEDLDDGMRLSTLAAGGSDQWRAQEITRTMNRVFEAQAAINRGNVNDADRLLAQDAAVTLPNPLEAVRRMTVGLVRKQRRQDRDALKAFDEAAALNPNLPFLDLQRGMLHSRLEEDAAALEDFKAYRAVVGDDALVCYEMAEALRALNRIPEASVLYRRALDENPRMTDAFVGLCRGLYQGGGSRADLAERLGKIDNPRETFNLLAEECREVSNGESLDALARGMQQIRPDYAAGDYYLSLAKAWAGETDDAVVLILHALRKETNQATKGTYINHFMQAMARAGDPVPAYSLSTDSRSAFRLMADELKKGYREVPLQMLVAAHAKRSPKDPLLRLYKAEQMVQQQKYAEADEQFDAAVGRVDDADVLEPFRSSRVLARFHTGKAMKAYLEIGPHRETFSQLRYLCLQKRDFVVLQVLIDAHQKAEPDDPALASLAFEMKIEQKEFAAAVTAFKAAYAKAARDDAKKEILADFLYRMQAAGKALEGYQAAPDPEEAFSLLLDDMSYGKESDELAKVADVHRQKHPNDPRLALAAAERFSKQEAWGKAAAVLRPWLEKAPETLAERFQSRYIYFRSRSGQAAAAYDEVPNRAAALRHIVNLLLAEKKGREAEMLIAKHMLAARDADPDILILAMRAKVLLGKTPEAIAFLRQACELQKQDSTRNYYSTQFVQAMIQQGNGLEAYRSAPDRNAAFPTLAADLVRRKKEAELKALLDEHAAGHAADANFHHYRGERHLLRNELDEAILEFAQTLNLAGYQKRYWRYGWQRALIRAGRVLVAYEGSGSRNLAFETLAQECSSAKNADQLRQLVAAHRQTTPDDPRLPEWDAELVWLKGDYAATLDFLTKNREQLLLTPRYRWMLDERRIRCLVRLKRTAEAVQIAEERAKADDVGVRTFQVLAHAAHGDVNKTLEVMEKMKDLPYLLSQCYHDEDLGPILKSDRFKAVREKYPQPKDSDLDDD
jgi:predicted Zn-dependent protease